MVPRPDPLGMPFLKLKDMTDFQHFFLLKLTSVCALYLLRLKILTIVFLCDLNTFSHLKPH